MSRRLIGGYCAGQGVRDSASQDPLRCAARAAERSRCAVWAGARLDAAPRTPQRRLRLRLRGAIAPCRVRLASSATHVRRACRLRLHVQRANAPTPCCAGRCRWRTGLASLACSASPSHPACCGTDTWVADLGRRTGASPPNDGRALGRALLACARRSSSAPPSPAARRSRGLRLNAYAPLRGSPFAVLPAPGMRAETAAARCACCVGEELFVRMKCALTHDETSPQKRP